MCEEDLLKIVKSPFCNNLMLQQPAMTGALRSLQRCMEVNMRSTVQQFENGPAAVATRCGIPTGMSEVGLQLVLLSSEDTRLRSFDHSSELLWLFSSYLLCP